MTADDVCPCSSVRMVSEMEMERNGDILKAASITLISVAVVSSPVNAHQSLTTRPAPMTSEPRLTVPAYLLVRHMGSRDDRNNAPRVAPGANYSARSDLVCSSWGARGRLDS